MDSETLQIRSYCDADEGGVVRLWNSVFPNDPPWNEPVTVIRRKVAVQPELFLVAILDGSVVGTTLAGFDGCRGWIHHVGVDPSARRRGVGSLLVREAAARLRGIGCPKLNLQIRAANQTAIQFYESLEFSVESRVSMAQLLEPGAGWPLPQ